MEVHEEQQVRMMFVGSPLLDISAKCDQALLDEFDLRPDDCVRAKDHHDPLFQRLFRCAESYVSAGGSAQNTARCAKWTLGSKGDVCFIGCTGDDEYRTLMTTKLNSEGVSPFYIPIHSAKTGVCACLVSSDGKRSMCTRQGAASLFSTEHLYFNNVRPRLRRAHCIFVVGYFAVHSPRVLFELADKCDPEQVFSVSLSAEYVCRDFANVLTRVLSRVDVLFGNEAEVKAFVAAAAGGRPSSTAEESVLQLREISRPIGKRPRIVVISQGCEAVIVDEGFGDLKKFPVPKCSQIGDSVGCGDALAGAFLATFIDTRDVSQAVLSGIQAAGKVLQVCGFHRPKSRIYIEL